MNNKETKGFFYFSCKKPSFFAYVISWKQNADRQNQLQNIVFHVKTSQSAKI